MPAFRDLVVYQFHIGVYYAVDGSGNDARRNRPGTFLDVVDRLEYLVDLGINAIEPLPVIEFPTTTSEGYNYTDYFSPEMDYTLPPVPTSSGSPAWSTGSSRPRGRLRSADGSSPRRSTR